MSTYDWWLDSPEDTERQTVTIECGDVSARVTLMLDRFVNHPHRLTIEVWDGSVCEMSREIALYRDGSES